MNIFSQDLVLLITNNSRSQSNQHINFILEATSLMLNKKPKRLENSQLLRKT